MNAFYDSIKTTQVSPQWRREKGLNGKGGRDNGDGKNGCTSTNQ